MDFIDATLRYNELIVKYDTALGIAIIRKAEDTWAGVQDEINLPISCLSSKLTYSKHNLGERKPLDFRGYRVDEIERGNISAWVYYYPSHYEKTGLYLKIDAVTYYESLDFPLLEIPATLNDDLVISRLMNEDQYDGKIVEVQADAKLQVRENLAPKKIEGSDISVKIHTIHLPVPNSQIEEIPARNWRDWYDDLGDDAFCECVINETPCFIGFKHLKIK